MKFRSRVLLIHAHLCECFLERNKGHHTIHDIPLLVFS